MEAHRFSRLEIWEPHDAHFRVPGKNDHVHMAAGMHLHYGTSCNPYSGYTLTPGLEGNHRRGRGWSGPPHFFEGGVVRTPPYLLCVPWEMAPTQREVPKNFSGPMFELEKTRFLACLARQMHRQRSTRRWAWSALGHTENAPTPIIFISKPGYRNQMWIFCKKKMKWIFFIFFIFEGKKSFLFSPEVRLFLHFQKIEKMGSILKKKE